MKQKKKHYQVSIEPSVADAFRAAGGGSISRGIEWFIADNERLLNNTDRARAALMAVAGSTNAGDIRKALKKAQAHPIT